jgi:nucleoside-diphosphate-sugar epimerase
VTGRVKKISAVFREDLELIAQDDTLPWSELSQSVVFITGATGLIGSALVAALAIANENRSLGLKIIAGGQNRAKAEFLLSGYAPEIIIQDIREPLAFDGPVDYFFHCAAMTKSSEMVATPVDVIETSVLGTKNILALAREKQAKSLVYLSSMEVYGRMEGEVAESDLGYLDLSNPRTSYPESKRLGESLGVAYAAQHGLPVKIARLGLTFGAGTPRDDSRVFAQFARSAMAGQNIELHTAGHSLANCCYTADAILGLLTLLLKGVSGEAYNIANPGASLTIREMAELAAGEIGRSQIKVVLKIPDDIAQRGYAPEVRLKLDVSRLCALGWSPKYGLAEMYRRMMLDWNDARLRDGEQRP